MLTHGTNPKQVALTFDDGPSEWTLRLLEVLDYYDAKATFLVLGKNLCDHIEALNSILRHGHELGNHSVNHLCLGDHPDQIVREQIMDCEAAINTLTGHSTRLFRPPYGRILNTPVDKIAESMGYKVVGWSCCPGDWAAKNARDIVMHVTEQLMAATRGEIVLLHDGSPDGKGDRSYTVDAVDIILRMFPDREFCTVSKLDGLQ